MASTATALTETDARQMVAPFQANLVALAADLDELKSIDPSPLKASMALELARKVKQAQTAFQQSEERQRVYELGKTFRWLSSIMTARVINPLEDALKTCSKIRSDWEIQRRRLVAETIRQRESQQSLELKAERVAQVQHLQEIGKPEQAEVLQAAPLPVVAVNVDEDLGRPTDESLVEVWAPELDTDGEVVFSDRKAFYTWVAENESMHHLVGVKLGKLKKLLTDNRGVVQPPGLKIAHRFEPRTRQEQGA